ncbi:MAG: PhnD/SsuA/transferrin family substrate-binding protein [Chloroflexi bacterium]|nr:PhnD/SsuA/transferrin family substrate-binding protein [Chloroflexota bacterium]
MDSIHRLSVCPHDTAKNLFGWFLLNTYLQRKTGCALHFEPCHTFIEERGNVLSNAYHLVYTNPYSALIFNAELGFIPIAKPIGVFDETVMIARRDADLPSGRIKIATATDMLIVYDLGLAVLEQQNILREQCDFTFVGTHLRTVQVVADGEFDLGFVFSETWHGLTESTRQQLRVVAESSSQLAYHCFCVAPEWLDRREQLREILCGMQNDAHGKPILDDLHIQGFEALPMNALDSLRALVEKMA